MTELCYKKCAGTSGDKLDSREQQCLSNCTDRFMDAMNVVTKSIQK